MTDPLHRPGSVGTAWTMINIAEAFPGVMTPLNWTFMHECTTLAVRETFHRIGAYPRSVEALSADPDEDLWSIFYGRCAANLDTLRALGDRMPATSGDDLERQIFGDVRPGVSGRQYPARYPLVAAKLIRQFRGLPVEVARCRADTVTWWERVVFGAPADTPQAARAVLAEAQQRFRRAMQLNSMGAFLGSMMFEQIGGLSSAEPLMTGYGDFEEVRTMTDLWEVSRDRLPMQDFLRRHGYHGPGEGEMSSRSWREDPGPVETLAKTYSSMSEKRCPAATQARRIAGREAAERALLASLPALKRAPIRMLLNTGRRIIPLREVTKGCFVRALDGARWAARCYGELLHTAGRIDDQADLFHLTFEEILTGHNGDLRTIVAERREFRARYQALELPDRWVGRPEPMARAAPPQGEVTGLGVSPGTASGRACVITDPSRLDELRDGDVLVCELTDPGWTSMFLVSAAVVIDTGSPMSHGAVVARELGIPCVVNTGTGSSRIHTGDHVEVDGSTGRVRILQEAR
jgi:pyruvate,water dikinase